MSSVKIAELKSKLSACLKKVRRGSELVVMDRETPIAKIVPYEAEGDDFEVLEAAEKPATLKAMKPVRLKPGVDPLEALRKDRERG